MEWNGMEWNGLDWTGLDCWTGLDWTRLEWNGIEWKGHMRTVAASQDLMEVEVRKANDIVLLSCSIWRVLLLARTYYT